MAEQSRSVNFLELPIAEFKRATKVFAAKQLKLGKVLLAFEGGFLSIESGDVTAVMRATGQWHGRATFSPEILRAIATVPPAHNPLTISYADGNLLIGSITVPCQWQSLSQAFIRHVETPNLIDLLALERTIPRVEIKGTARGRQIAGAVQRAEQRIKKAVAQLADLEVSEAEIRSLVETKIASRIGVKKPTQASNQFSPEQIQKIQLIASAISQAIDDVIEAGETSLMSDAKQSVFLAFEAVKNDTIIPEQIRNHILAFLDDARSHIIGARSESSSTAYGRASASQSNLASAAKFLEEKFNLKIR